MIEIAQCESGIESNALNDTPATGDYSIGILQINLYGDLKEHRPSEEYLKDPFNNIDYGYQIYTSQGYDAWKNCDRIVMSD